MPTLEEVEEMDKSRVVDKDQSERATIEYLRRCLDDERRLRFFTREGIKGVIRLLDKCDRERVWWRRTFHRLGVVGIVRPMMCWTDEEEGLSALAALPVNTAEILDSAEIKRDREVEATVKGGQGEDLQETGGGSSVVER